MLQAICLYNGHGDVVQLTSSTGQVLWRYDYDAFGNEREIDGQGPANDTNPFRYCGEYFDKETGTIYLRARNYSPGTGRFTQQDNWDNISSKDPLRLNLYVYCHNNPIAFVDPSGATEVMLDYIVNKNDGSNAYSYTYFLWIIWDEKYTVTIGNTTKTYKVGDQLRYVNGVVVIDHNILMDDFGLDFTQAQHRAGDKFDSADHAAMAFGLIYNPLSIYKQWEYGANIYKKDNKYLFSDVTTDKSADSVHFKSPNSKLGIHTATIHTHGSYKSSYNYGNDLFSPTDKRSAYVGKMNIYVVTPGGYLKKYYYDQDKTKTITDKMPYDPEHPEYKK